MARAIWTGAINFGLVSVPVAVYSATEGHEVAFHQFERDTSDRIRYKRVNERTDDEVDYSDVVKGADTGRGHYVMLDQDELDSVAPGRSRSMDIQTFVDLDEIDPIYYQKTYYLGPPDKDTAKTYGLLRDAMAATNRAAIANFVMRGKEYLTAIRPDHDLLVLHTMYFADEVRDPKKEVKNLPGASSRRGKELKAAEQLVNSMSGKWRPKDYHDTYTERVQELIDAKRQGDEVDVSEEAPGPTDVVDLMSALQASVKEARSGRSKRGGKSRSGPSKARGSAAKKNAPKKSGARNATKNKGSGRQKKAS